MTPDDMPRDADGGYVHEGELLIDGDGAPNCYAPVGSGLVALDYLANAGGPGNWYGIYTVNGIPIIQGPNDPCPGYYVSTTSYQQANYCEPSDPDRYLDATKIPFIVVPSWFVRGVAGIVMGCRAVVSYGGTLVEAMAGDVGPAFGEISVCAAQQAGLPNCSPKNGGVQSGGRIVIYPGQPSKLGYPLQPS
jgi:hypothetical protein